MRALDFITSYGIFKLCYSQIFQMKTTNDKLHYKDEQVGHHVYAASQMVCVRAQCIQNKKNWDASYEASYKALHK